MKAFKLIAGAVTCIAISFTKPDPIIHNIWLAAGSILLFIGITYIEAPK